MYDLFINDVLSYIEHHWAIYNFQNVKSTSFSSKEFDERLQRKEIVTVVPGGTLGPSGEVYVRACYAAAYEEIEEAMSRIERFVARLRDGA